MIHELRIYRCTPGRLPALLKRFENTTLPLWNKHGMRPIGFWTVEIGESNADLYYLLEWDTLAERETGWASFLSDPEWITERNESEKDGPMVAFVKNAILRPTSFSPMKRLA